MRNRQLPCCWLAAIQVVSLLLACLGGFERTAMAAAGDQVLLPSVTAAIKNGLRLHVDTRWVEAPGYRPVRLELQHWPPGPFPVDRQLTVELTPNHRFGGLPQTTTSQLVELPQGVNSVTATISVPQHGVWSGLKIRVFEGGAELEELRSVVGERRSGQTNWSEALPAFLFIDSDTPPRGERDRLVAERRRMRTSEVQTFQLPDVRRVAELIPGNPYHRGVVRGVVDSRADDVAVLDEIERLDRFELLPFEELPERWLDLSCFAVAFISRGDLGRLAAEHPRRFAALRDWTRAGSTLCVYDVGDQLEQVATQLGLPAEPADWTLPKSRDYRADFEQALNRLGREFSGSRSSSGSLPPPDDADAFLLHGYGGGQVQAVRSEYPFQDRPLLCWMLNSVNPQNWVWFERHGMSLNRANNDYWTFMIPDVGMPPVFAFLVLITVFVVLVGPLNYFWLKRIGRLYLLLVLVPLVSGVMTLALLCYALLSDGLGARLRVRGYSEVDQTAGTSASWSRQTYYASLTPSRGLLFPESAAVFPLVLRPRSQEEGSRRLDLRWNPEQNLRRGFLRARTTTQFVVVQSGPSGQALEVDETGSGTPRVRNELGGAVRMLVLRDRKGDFYWSDRIDEAQQGALESVEGQEAQRRIATLLRTHRPALPAGFDPADYNRFSIYGRRYFGDNTDRRLPPPQPETSILERKLSELEMSGVEQLPSRSYLAVVDDTPLVPLGIPVQPGEGSIHLVRGSW